MKFQEKLQRVHKRLLDQSEIDVVYYRLNGGTISMKGVPVFYVSEQMDLGVFRIERQIFYFEVSQFVESGAKFVPSIGDKILWGNDVYKIVSPASEINPKSNNTVYDYTTSDRTVIKVETIREKRGVNVGA